MADETITQPPVQQPAPSKAEKLYDNLLKDGYTEKNLGKKSDFINRVQNPIEANKLYSVLRNDGYSDKNLGDMVTFRNNLIVKKKVDTPASPNGVPPSSNGSKASQSSQKPTNGYFSNYNPADLQKEQQLSAQRHKTAPLQMPKESAKEQVLDPHSDYYKALAQQREDYEKKYPGSWSNAPALMTHNIVRTVTDAVGGLSNAMRDVIATAGGKNADKAIYDKNGNLTPYGDAVDKGQQTDPLAKLTIGLNAYGQATTEEDYKNPLPHNIWGNTATGAINLLPIVGLTALAPEAEAGEGANLSTFAKVKNAVWNPLTKIGMAQDALNTYNEAKEKGKTPEEAVKETGKQAYKSFLTYGSMGLGGLAGDAISAKWFKNLEDANLVKNGKLTKAGTDIVANTSVFAALPVAQSVFTGKPVTKEEIESNIGVGLLFGGIHAIKNGGEDGANALNDRQAIAMQNFMNASPEAIASAYALPHSTGDLNAMAVKETADAENAKDEDKGTHIATASTLAKASDVKGVAQAIVHDKNGFLDDIKNSDLPDEYKQAITSKINDIHSILHPAEQFKADAKAKIDELDASMLNNQPRLQSEDPIERADAEVVQEKLDNEKAALTKGLKDVIAHEYERQTEQAQKEIPPTIYKDEPKQEIQADADGVSEKSQSAAGETPEKPAEPDAEKNPLADKSDQELKDLMGNPDARRDLGVYPRDVADEMERREQKPAETETEKPTLVKEETPEYEKPKEQPSESEKPVVEAKPKKETDKAKQSEIEDINKRLKASQEGGGDSYIPYSERVKLQKRRAELQKQTGQEVTEPQMAGYVTMPFMNEFIENDVKPVVQKIAAGFKEAGKAIIKAVRPQTGVALKDVDTITKNLNTRNEEAAKLDKAINSIEKMFDKMPEDERIDFIDNIKRGRKQPTPELQAIADMYNQMDKDLYDAINSIKGNLAFKDNHFRVLWKELPGSQKSRAWFAKSKRPLEGSKGFLRQATLSDMSEGIERGGVPLSTNPMTMFKAAHADAMKYITANRMFDALKADKTVRFYKNRSEVPENFVEINDKIAKIYFPVKEGMVKAGEWYIEKNAGRMVNNLLSEDKIRNTEIGKGILAIKNLYTGIELSLSPYHATAMSFEAVSSDIGRGLRKAVNLGLKGDFKGATEGMIDMIKAPFAPKSTFSLGRNYIKLASQADFENSDFGKEFLKRNPMAKQYLHDFFMGGGLTAQDEDYKLNAYKAFKENLGKQNYIGAALRAVPALNEQVMSPLFDYYIPSLKVGMFMKEFPLALQENEVRLNSGKTTREAIARKTIDFIDDRLGEMNFDNLYWDRTFKTGTQLFVRSVTWKLGNARAIGGAIPEQGMEIYNAMKEGRTPTLQPKMAWLLGAAMVHATAASLIQYAFTGTYPKNFKDLMFPRISNDDPKKRLQIPDYGRDVAEITNKGLVEYGWSSLAGDMTKAIDIWNNHDFQKYEIYDPDASIYTKTKDAAKYMMPQPIGLSQDIKDYKKGDLLSPKGVAHFIGFSNAPGYVAHSAVENKIFDLYNFRNGGVKSLQQKAAADAKQQILDLYYQNKSDEADKLFDEMVDKGVLKETDFKSINRKLAGIGDPSTFFFNELPDEDKIYLYKQMSEEQREKYDPKGKVGIMVDDEAQRQKKDSVKNYSSFSK